MHVPAVLRSALQSAFAHGSCLSLLLTQPVHHWDHQPACEDDPEPRSPSQLQVGIFPLWGNPHGAVGVRDHRSCPWAVLGTHPNESVIGDPHEDQALGLSLPSQKGLMPTHAVWG